MNIYVYTSITHGRGRVAINKELTAPAAAAAAMMEEPWVRFITAPWSSAVLC